MSNDVLVGWYVSAVLALMLMVLMKRHIDNT
jgi:hypothetical protein